MACREEVMVRDDRLRAQEQDIEDLKLQLAVARRRDMRCRCGRPLVAKCAAEGVCCIASQWIQVHQSVITAKAYKIE